MEASCAVSRARRRASTLSYTPGYYRSLNDACVELSSTSPPLTPSLTADEPLPQGIYLVDRLVAARKKKVSATLIIRKVV